MFIDVSLYLCIQRSMEKSIFCSKSSIQEKVIVLCPLLCLT